MSANFHPSDRLLTDYGVGDLPLAPGLVVSAHLERCALCRSRVRDVEETEGRRLLEGSAGVAMRPDALDAVLSRLSYEVESEPPVSAPTMQIGDADLPGAVAQIGLKRRRFLGSGLWTARVDLAEHDDWRSFVLRVPAGTTVPSHGHSGEELIAVLAGSFTDGKTYAADDFVECGANRDHDLKVVGDTPCVCLIAVHGPLLWKGWSRVAGMALGI